MGIHLSSIAQINSTSQEFSGIKYFVYLINYYNIDESVIEELLDAVPQMNEKFSKLGNVVSVSSVKNIDFSNDAISWDNCFGLDAGEVCPAILVCTLPPNYFILQALSGNVRIIDEPDADVPWILLGLGRRGRDIEDLKSIIQRIIEEASTGSDISRFDKKRILQTIDGRPVVNGEASLATSRLLGQDIFKRLGATWRSET